MTEIDFCWSRIGIAGDHTCPELARVIHCRNCAVFARAARQALDRPAPAEYLEQWAERVAAAAEDDHGEMQSHVVFQLSGQTLALPTVTFAEALEPRPVHAIPHRSGSVLLGLTNVRGELQLCVALDRLLQLPAATDVPPRPRLAVIEHDGERWAFPVDEIRGVHRVAQDDCLAPDEGEVSPFICGQFRLDGSEIRLLDAALVCAALRRAVA